MGGNNSLGKRPYPSTNLAAETLMNTAWTFAHRYREATSEGGSKAGSPGDPERPEAAGSEAPGQGIGAASEESPLSDRHRQMLEMESAIAPEVIESRGYRTIADVEELLDLGFQPYQALIPGLLIPLHDPWGNISSYQYRPDDPRKSSDGKIVKYETRAGHGQVLDANPVLGERLRDPNEPLIVTEGARKADAAISRGYAAVALSGVWCWRKDRVQLPEWEDIKLYGREVYVAFDSDTKTNPHVHKALKGLCEFLHERGANA
jgi:hypothetical protein